MAAAWNEAARNIAPAYKSTVEIEKRIDEFKQPSRTSRSSPVRFEKSPAQRAYIARCKRRSSIQNSIYLTGNIL